MHRFFARLFRSHPATARRPQRLSAFPTIEALEGRAAPALFGLRSAMLTNAAPAMAMAADQLNPQPLPPGPTGNVGFVSMIF
jgi:hypothetical protein